MLSLHYHEAKYCNNSEIKKTSPETTVLDLPENVLLSLYEINYIIFDLCETKIWQRTFRVRFTTN